MTTKRMGPKPLDFEDAIGAAVIEHLRWWWGGDALFQRQIFDGSHIDPATIRRITNAYGVSRGFRKGNETDIGRLIEQRLREWPASLPEKAKFIQHLAEEAHSNGHTKGVQLSGFSKLLWFIKPRDWTLYDSYACRGLIGSVSGNRFDAYYHKLEQLGFLDTMQRLRDVISNTSFPYLWPERILDKYLMRCGHDLSKGFQVIDQGSHKDLLVLWETFHGKSFSEDLRALIHNLVAAVADEPLFKVHSGIGPKKCEAFPASLLTGEQA